MLLQEIENIVSLTGRFPFERVVSQEVLEGLRRNCIPPISEFDPDLSVCWAVPRSIKEKTTKGGKKYYEIELTDSNSIMTKIRCWGVDPTKGDKIVKNVPYLIKPDHNGEWGFSTRGKLSDRWKLLA